MALLNLDTFHAHIFKKISRSHPSYALDEVWKQSLTCIILSFHKNSTKPQWFQPWSPPQMTGTSSGSCEDASSPWSEPRRNWRCSTRVRPPSRSGSRTGTLTTPRWGSSSKWGEFKRDIGTSEARIKNCTRKFVRLSYSIPVEPNVKSLSCS